MNNYGIKFARKGKGADSSDPRDLIISSEFNTIKVSKEAYGKAYDSSTEQWADNWGLEGIGFRGSAVTHGLDYSPIIFFYIQINGLWQLAPSKSIVNVDGNDWKVVNMVRYANESVANIWVGLEPVDIAPIPFPEDIYYKYYILIEPREGAWYE